MQDICNRNCPVPKLNSKKQQEISPAVFKKVDINNWLGEIVVHGSHYKEAKISKEKYTSEIQSCENITNYIENLIKSDN